MNSRTRLSLLAAVLVAACSTTSQVAYQASTLDALMRGDYDGEVTFRDLARRGDFGLGTFHRLDGEMVGFDGQFYQIRADGVARPVSPDTTTPFAMVLPFRPDREVRWDEEMTQEAFQARLDGLRRDKAAIMAIRVDGTFRYLKARSVPAQDKPYVPLPQVLETQPIFEFEEVEGTLVGFWCPPSVGGLNVPGYHFHFLTADRTAGGHVLDVRPGAVRIQVQETRDLHVHLPMAP